MSGKQNCQNPFFVWFCSDQTFPECAHFCFLWGKVISGCLWLVGPWKTVACPTIFYYPFLFDSFKSAIDFAKKYQHKKAQTQSSFPIGVCLRPDEGSPKQPIFVSDWGGPLDKGGDPGSAGNCPEMGVICHFLASLATSGHFSATFGQRCPLLGNSWPFFFQPSATLAICRNPPHLHQFK